MSASTEQYVGELFDEHPEFAEAARMMLEEAEPSRHILIGVHAKLVPPRSEGVLTGTVFLMPVDGELDQAAIQRTISAAIDAFCDVVDAAVRRDADTIVVRVYLGDDGVLEIMDPDEASGRLVFE